MVTKSPAKSASITRVAQNITPVAMVILLEAYYKTGQVEYTTVGERSALEYLKDKNLVSTTTGQGPNKPLTVQILSRGRFYVKMLLATPLPVRVSQWMDPNNAPDVDDEDDL